MAGGGRRWRLSSLLGPGLPPAPPPPPAPGRWHRTNPQAAATSPSERAGGRVVGASGGEKCERAGSGDPCEYVHRAVLATRRLLHLIVKHLQIDLLEPSPYCSTLSPPLPAPHPVPLLLLLFLLLLLPLFLPLLGGWGPRTRSWRRGEGASPQMPHVKTALTERERERERASF